MHRNLFWQAFLIVMLCIVLWYSIIALYRYYLYSRLTAQTEVLSTSWSVQENSEEEYLIKGRYTYSIRGKMEEGTTLFKDEIYRNRWAAEQDIPQYSQKKWKVWVVPTSPQYSSLQKSFPLKELLSAVFLWGLLLYFLWLGYYVSRFKNQ